VTTTIARSPRKPRPPMPLALARALLLDELTAAKHINEQLLIAASAVLHAHKGEAAS
jgi:hypothetical protein